MEKDLRISQKILEETIKKAIIDFVLNHDEMYVSEIIIRNEICNIEEIGREFLARVDIDAKIKVL